MSYLRLGRLILLGLAGAIAAAQAPVPPSLQPAVPPSENATFKLDGFRSAHFGMTDAQVKQAVRRDFNLGPDRITSAENPVDRTTVLTVSVRDLLPGSGAAQVVYVLGFSTKKLIQVTVTWGGTVNPALKAETAVAMANQLRNYLVTVGYKPDSMVVNTRMPDGTFVVFRGFDAEDRMTILTLAGAEAPEGAANAPAPVLSLSYVLDIRNPDIYRIPRGQF
jgi:hypothetical protein